MDAETPGCAVFSRSFTQQTPIPEAARHAAMEVLESGRLHRYNTVGDELSETALLERDYAKWQGATYCLACASGGQAMQIALRAAGVVPGAPVLTNAFTLAPVPGAIAAVGAVPVLVEVTKDLTIDLADLEAKAKSSGAKHLLLSHMRGHLADMEALCEITERHDITLIEDCAHTMGAAWNGRRSGNFGLAGCFSTQTYKHINSGEGGLLTSDDAAFMARAIILSGSYMLYERHGAAPGPEAFAEARLDMPNMSARMDNLRAAILRPQLQTLDDAVAAWNARYAIIAKGLAAVDPAILPQRPEAETYVGSSIQFRLEGLDAKACEAFLSKLSSRGVEVKWFGREAPHGFTSSHRNWQYVPRTDLPQTDNVLSVLFDMRIPLTFTLDDCDLLAEILRQEIEQALAP